MNDSIGDERDRALGDRATPNGLVAVPEFLAAGGEMGALMRATDWSKTRLGPIETWPNSLRTMLGVVLGSRFPMLLWWGPDLLHLYNDAYRPILRDKHPASLAAPASEVWAEVWDVAGPMARSVQQGGPATWTEDLQLFINSGAMAEETYFTFSYSPVPGDDGRIGGVLNTVQETTAKVQSERQIRMLHELAARASEPKSEHAAYRVVAEVLSANELDLPFFMLYALNETADGFVLCAANAWQDYAGPAKPAQISIAESASSAAWPIAEALRGARETVIDDLPRRFGSLPLGRWNARPERAIVLPLSRPGQTTPYALLIAGISPHRELDEQYRRFFQATADQVTTVIVSAGAYETETKRAEALAEIDRTKTAFFSNVSHEFRTPLTLMLGPLEDALATPERTLSANALLMVHRNALRLMKLVNSLLDFSRIEAGRMSARYEPTDLAALTTDLASTFRAAIERGGLRFDVRCEPCTEPSFVDHEMWEKIVLNLLSNAFKFTLEGSIGVALRQHDDWIELCVSDTGSGIPAHELPHLFERFHRVQGTESRTHEGSGIGLALVHELVHLHGGSIAVASTPGHGTSFTLRMPLGSAHLPQERIAERASASDPSRHAAPFVDEALHSPMLDEPDAIAKASSMSSEQPRILVVDDNADLREYISGLLRSSYHVETAVDGMSALAIARTRKPDLILSDIMMPRLDGFGLLHELRADPSTRDVPVILLSARAGEQSAIEGLDAGADDYLAKPFSARELLARVGTHVKLERMRREWTSALEKRSLELAESNKELEAFCYSVSHDLRAPLRAINGYAAILTEDHDDKLDAEARRLLGVIRSGGIRMGRLIDDLLAFSRLGRKPLAKSKVDMGALVRAVFDELHGTVHRQPVQLTLKELPNAPADRSMIEQVWVNLLSNALKYSSKRAASMIEVGAEVRKGSAVYFVKDNGVGFDMRYANKLFGVFQRLHNGESFEGTGVGLALVDRIVRRHGGRAWAEAEVDAGATFYFSLPDDTEPGHASR